MDQREWSARLALLASYAAQGIAISADVAAMADDAGMSHSALLDYLQSTSRAILPAVSAPLSLRSTPASSVNPYRTDPAGPPFNAGTLPDGVMSIDSIAARVGDRLLPQLTEAVGSYIEGRFPSLSPAAAGNQTPDVMSRPRLPAQVYPAARDLILRAGDIVKLLSGGPDMVVYRVSEYVPNPELPVQEPPQGVEVHVHYVSGDGSIRTAALNNYSLCVVLQYSRYSAYSAPPPTPEPNPDPTPEPGPFSPRRQRPLDLDHNESTPVGGGR